VQTFKGKAGFAFLDEREMHLKASWFHYSPPETFSHVFRSPDWFQWRDGDLAGSIETMKGLERKPDRARAWAEHGVSAVRAQVVDAPSIDDPRSPLNYLLTYLAVTHPEEDRLIIDADRAAGQGVVLPEVDFLIHDDDVVFTKYEGEPAVVYRDAYYNQPPARPDAEDDRPFFRHFAAAADELLAHRDEILYLGSLVGLDLLAVSEAGR
jgi:hypothetical protein